MQLSRRRYLSSTLLYGGMALLLTNQTAACAAAFDAVSVSVRQFGASGDGMRDDTVAFQRAHDSLSGGGTIIVPAGVYNVDKVLVRNRGIRVSLDAGATIRKLGSAGLASRGIFVLENLDNAKFELTGGTIDLNGEGPMGIGSAGRIPNLYANQTIPSIVALAGPTNAAIYALETSGISVRGVSVANSGENGLLFRNCADVVVDGCTFTNLANYGVELSFIERAPISRLRASFTPGNTTVRNCRFSDIDDYGLGSGNGCGVGGGGAAGQPGGILVDSCTFERCQRDVHFEMHAPGRAADITVRRLQSIGARQGSIGLVGVARPVIENCQIRDAGSSPTAVLGAGFPEIYGIVLSGGSFSAAITDVSIVDSRSIRTAIGRGSIARRSRTLTAGSATFEPGDVGRIIGIDRGNPGRVVYVGRIAEVVSATRAILDLPAGADVRNGHFAIGGNTRNGVVMRGGQRAAIARTTIAAGAIAEAGGEPAAAAVMLENMATNVMFTETQISPPARARGAPAGIRSRNAGYSLAGAGNKVTGFFENLPRP
ncbi:MAG: right-handed parallel beta-helix repeat-containing protein [Tsuneonella sp.]